LDNESAGYPPSYALPPPAHPAGLGSSRGIHGEVTPPTDNASSPDNKDSKSANGKSSQPRKGSNSRKRKSSEAEVPEIKVERAGTPSDYNSNYSTPQAEMGDDKGAFSGTQDSKRRRFLERNRLAASKCRQKKKEWASHLEDQARYQAQENKLLRASVAQLRDECLYLKNFLLSTHSGCQCVGVKNYLMKEAQLSQQVAAGIAGGVMPLAGMIHPGYAMMGMGPPSQYGIEMPGDRRRSGSVSSGPTQGSMSPR
jgi:bZIP transcription factor